VISETGGNNSKPVPAESFKAMITPKRIGAEDNLGLAIVQRLVAEGANVLAVA